MFIKSGTIGIIADDLTGANDTALQFHLRGCNTQILFDYNSLPEGILNTHAWAISTETRNLPVDEAVTIVKDASKNLIENLNTEYFYKKIDSTLRGNIAQESLALLNALGWDSAVILPAFPSEGRVTVGGYHLLKGVPIDRTELARDPHAPVRESHIPTLLAQQAENPEIVGHIELKTVTKGAGPILMELQVLIKEGKKLIVVDAVSTTDIEQAVLAIEKSNYNILPCGSAALAQAFGNAWLPEMKHQHIAKKLPDMPILVVSGSATGLTKTQIEKVIESDDFEPYVIELALEQVMQEPSEELVERIAQNLNKYKMVIIHSSSIENDPEKNIEYAQHHNIQPEQIPSFITDYLASLTQKVIEKQEVILVLVGGETSYKCCNAISSKHLQLIDEVEPAVPLCLDHKAQWVVTKSGNLGNPVTLVNILKYFERHK
jgi:D-threonate/D-erythronate kinase